ncbi:hypothetical protein ACFO0M_29795 [Micromonospora mangrovi]|uniref:Uncharacterized protein n=2 Tax=Micromonospora TaxID=1873 RepID=A0AAU7MBI1_9ACTN
MTERPEEIAALVRQLTAARLTREHWSAARRILVDLSAALDGGDGDVEVAMIRLEHLLDRRRLSGRANTMMDDPSAQQADEETREVADLLIARLGSAPDGDPSGLGSDQGGR